MERERGPADRSAKLRQVGSKTFYFKENRWIDSTVKPDEDAKAKRIRQFSDEFFSLARSQSAELNQYLTFTEPVTLKLAGTVYRIDPAERQAMIDRRIARATGARGRACAIGLALLAPAVTHFLGCRPRRSRGG